MHACGFTGPSHDHAPGVPTLAIATIALVQTSESFLYAIASVKACENYLPYGIPFVRRANNVIEATLLLSCYHTLRLMLHFR